ncbi:SDR family oxidoreductase [Nesterenkonia aerolata]|uniref:SDR family oxidoreductase n=1 Tax=Nesterenkonia aerolata TaxID=3074079 RepID=A0ABU2DSY4_9MICC|nr:SDR family oxidoreductase [Nesterenkonia sp. LY-0111]MDR8019608.1 SDR family oxidoreductase [Nesterenkonia sp. LY-0111]
MAAENRVVIVGGHGKIALIAAEQLSRAGRSVESLIRNPAHRDDVTATGAQATVLDVEQADVAQLAETFSGAEAVVFSAGAGGGNPARTHAVDYEAAVRTMEAAAQAGVRRYIMVSYVRADTDVNTLDPENSFYPYAQAKHDADAHLRQTELDWTVLGPGALTLEPGRGTVQILDAEGTIDGAPVPDEQNSVPREDVASAITHAITAGAAVRQTRRFVTGETPLEEAIA